MSEYTYPDINQTKILLMLEIASNHPDYFTNPACPYNDRIKSLFAPKNAVTSFDDQIEDMETEPLTDKDMVLKITKLAKQLETYGQKALSSDNSSDANTFFRLSATLMERMVTLRERMGNVLDVVEFMDTVLAILEDVMTSDQRNIVLERLAKFDQREKS